MPPITRSQFQLLKSKKTGEFKLLRKRQGKDAFRPFNVQHPEISNWSRAKLQNLALGISPDVLVRNLEGQGFESIHTGGGNVSVRRPGQDWYVVEPEGVTGVGELIKDLTDVVGDVGTALGIVGGEVVGGVTGAALGAPTGPGAALSAFGGASLGGATGAAGATAVKAGLARAFGMDPTLAETGKAALVEGALGLAGPTIGKGVSAVAKPLLGGVSKAGGAVAQGLRGTADKPPPFGLARVQGAVQKRLPFNKAEAQEAMEKLGRTRFMERFGIDNKAQFAIEKGRKKGDLTRRLLRDDELVDLAVSRQPGVAQAGKRRGANISQAIRATGGREFELSALRVGEERLAQNTGRKVFMEGLPGEEFTHKGRFFPEEELPNFLEFAERARTLNKEQLIELAKDTGARVAKKDRPTEELASGFGRRISQPLNEFEMRKMPKEDLIEQLFFTQKGAILNPKRGAPTPSENLLFIKSVLRATDDPRGFKSAKVRNITRFSIDDVDVNLATPTGAQIAGGLVDIVGQGLQAPGAFGRGIISKNILSRLPETQPPGGGVRGFLGGSTFKGEAALTGVALGTAAATGSGTVATLAGLTFAASTAGRIVSAIGRSLMKDISGIEIQKIARLGNAPESVKLFAQQALQALRQGGPVKYRIIIWQMLRDPTVRAFLQDASQETEEANRVQ